MSLNAPTPAEPDPSLPRWHAPAVFLAGAILMVAVYGGDGFTRQDAGVPGNDSYYHVKMAAMLPELGLTREFPWLRFAYFTDEGQAFVSHHYGFHVLLAPFVHLAHRLTGEYYPGGRWANCFFLGCIFLVLDRLIRHTRAGTIWLWLPLLVLIPSQFYTRLAFIRAIVPSLLFMLLMLLFLFRSRGPWLALTIALYIHVYMGGVLYAPLIVAAYVASKALIEPREWRRGLRIAAWGIGGWVVGVVTHPYAFGMWEFLRLQVLGSGLSPDIPVGQEWKPYADLWQFAQMSGIVLGVWAFAILIRLRAPRPLTAPELCLFLLNFMFLVLTAKARRFIEYWPMFCLLNSIYLLAPYRPPVSPLSRLRTQRAAIRYGTFAAPLLSVLVTGGIIARTPVWSIIRKGTHCTYDLTAIREAMAFLQANSEPGDVVFTDDWDIFPVFFYFNSHNHYIVGLDPKFTQARQPELWERYVKVSRGEAPAEVTRRVDGKSEKKISIRLEDIRDHFGARFVVTDRDHKPLASKLSQAGTFAELIYPRGSYRSVKDDPYLIFRIQDPDRTD